MLYKSLVYFADLPIGGVVIGASVPVVLTSRSDSPESKMNSIALAAVIALSQPKSARK